MPNPHEKPVLIVVAGPDGAGKSSFADVIREHQWFGDCVYINPDEIALKKNMVIGIQQGPY